MEQSQDPLRRISISPEVRQEARRLQNELYETWSQYLQVIGPTLARSYRDGDLNRMPHETGWVTDVTQNFSEMARQTLIEIELGQDAWDGHVKKVLEDFRSD